jgi:photosystem II stability/assembly factor-like uncharacterized protein
MKGSYNNGFRPAKWCIVCIAVALAIAPLWADDALPMPKAAQSLLLDVVSTGTFLVAVGDRGHILRSAAVGAPWEQVPVPSQQMLTAVCFANDQRGWAVGHDGLILATVDGAKSWVVQNLLLAQQEAVNRDVVLRLEQRRLVLEQAFADEPDFTARHDLRQQLEDLMLDIEDAELTAAEAPYSPPLLDIFCPDALHAYAVGAFGVFLFTDDGGVSWQHGEQQLPNPDQYHLNSITGDAHGRLWIAGEGGLLFFSADGGNTWGELSSPYFGSYFGIEYQPRSSALLLFGLRGNVFLSTDGGSNWAQSKLDGQRSIAGGTWLNERYAIIVGSVGSVHISDDGGRLFRDVSLANRVNLSSVAIHKGIAVAVGAGGSYPLPQLGVTRD